MTRTNFTECALRYTPLNDTLIALYGWNGTVDGIKRNASTQITQQGCYELCGDGNDWYPWALSSSTITTWVLPVLGMLLQAPFVSNAFWQTVFSLARWVGSPMASLAYILWNIKVSGKCALIVDMAVPCGKLVPARHSDFSSIRDSFYLLMTMNQYTMRPKVRQKKEAEGLLRIVLFSKDLGLLKPDKATEVSEAMLRRSSHETPTTAYDSGTSRFPGLNIAPTMSRRPSIDLEPIGHLNSLRQALAADMRAGRKRGVVPVFITTMWFLFSLAISTQFAFGFLGQADTRLKNAEAHDLALGLLLAWMPVLILCSIVDRNPVSADEIKDKLNGLVERVRVSLMDETVRHHYLQSIHDRDDRGKMQIWVERISEQCPSMGKFFVSFAGQGRKRWHYGAAHPIITDIERAYIAGHGRDWLASEEEARTSLVLGVVSGGLDWFDLRELWQVLSAVIIVAGTVLGAFVLSFYTPTVGLGCRSGGYLVFISIAFGLLSTEMVTWWIIEASKPGLTQFGHSLERRMTRHGSLVSGTEKLQLWIKKRKIKATITLSSLSSTVHRRFMTLLSKTCSPAMVHNVNNCLHSISLYWQDLTLQKKLEHSFFRPAECINAIWLVYITLSQTFGAYNNCYCMTSTWGGHGGYLDFTQFDTTNSPFVKLYWTSGTVVSVTIMGLAMLYVVTEWCLQSHLSTADIHDAAHGLQRTRRFRTITFPLREAAHLSIEAAYILRAMANGVYRTMKPTHAVRDRSSRRSIKWTKTITCNQREHGHDTPGRQMADLTPGQQRARGSSVAPLINGYDEHGVPFLVTTPLAHFQEHASGTPSPRSSQDESPHTTASPQDLSSLDQRPTYERQPSSGSTPVSPDETRPLRS